MPQLAKIATVRGDNRRTGDVSINEAKRQQKARLRALERESRRTRLSETRCTTTTTMIGMMGSRNLQY